MITWCKAMFQIKQISHAIYSDLRETVTEKDERIQTWKLTSKKPHETQMKKIRDDLQEQVAIKSSMAEVLMNLDAKLQKWVDAS